MRGTLFPINESRCPTRGQPRKGHPPGSFQQYLPHASHALSQTLVYDITARLRGGGSCDMRRARSSSDSGACEPHGAAVAHAYQKLKNCHELDMQITSDGNARPCRTDTHTHTHTQRFTNACPSNVTRAHAHRHAIHLAPSMSPCSDDIPPSNSGGVHDAISRQHGVRSHGALSQ